MEVSKDRSEETRDITGIECLNFQSIESCYTTVTLRFRHLWKAVMIWGRTIRSCPDPPALLLEVSSGQK